MEVEGLRHELWVPPQPYMWSLGARGAVHSCLGVNGSLAGMMQDNMRF